MCCAQSKLWQDISVAEGGGTGKLFHFQEWLIPSQEHLCGQCEKHFESAGDQPLHLLRA